MTGLAESVCFISRIYWRERSWTVPDMLPSSCDSSVSVRCSSNNCEPILRWVVIGNVPVDKRVVAVGGQSGAGFLASVVFPGRGWIGRSTSGFAHEENGADAHLLVHWHIESLANSRSDQSFAYLCAIVVYCAQ